MFRLVSGILSICGVTHGPRFLKLHVVPSCRFLQHESLNHDVTQDSTRLFLSFSVHNN